MLVYSCYIHSVTQLLLTTCMSPFDSEALLTPINLCTIFLCGVWKAIRKLTVIRGKDLVRPRLAFLSFYLPSPLYYCLHKSVLMHRCLDVASWHSKCIQKDYYVGPRTRVGLLRGAMHTLSILCPQRALSLVTRAARRSEWKIRTEGHR